ncbi:CoF synthetase [Aquimarina sp. BL5]|uniref:CoF synthetase n=1 Tax=Aquimarina sp. BL5 TaxID=1714860 RepID=UPI000E51BCE9|nr:CoF synthetase [Aquimarina sp. BL5]AXT49814.1 CoF synthetase [Aquimarina sp. BL5]RKM87711.1 CoF synthetase [Aquimarina sp. BL5]
MKIFELLRNKAFWIVDALKGGDKKKHYNEIKFLIENPTSQEAINCKEKNIQNILDHAVQSTDYYKKYKGYASIEDFPVINKNIIKDNFESFQSKKFVGLPKFTLSTSGSTGTPFTIYQNKNKRLRNIADTIYFSEKAGFNIGFKLTYFRLWNAFEKKGVLNRFLQNIVPIDVFDLKDKSLIDRVIDTLSKSSSSNSWLGYASAYKEICKHLDSKNSSPISSNLKSVIAMSERLDDYTKQSIYKYFGTEVVSRYSNVENGILAQQPLGNVKKFEINEASYVVEILDLKSDKRVENGKPGRIVITDLFNYYVPMLRYDTGDIGIKDVIDGKPFFREVSGRKIDVIYNTKDEIITVNLVLLVNNYPELKQCQLIQKASGTYHFKLNSEQEFLREQEFINEFKTYLGEDASISIEYVDEIPLLASGKRRVMVNEMNL